MPPRIRHKSHLKRGVGARGEQDKDEPKPVFQHIFFQVWQVCYIQYMTANSHSGRYRPPAVGTQPRTANPATTGGRAIDRGINEAEALLVSGLDDLALFQEFQSDMLPKLRALIKRGAKTEEILELGRSLAVGRLVTIAATEEDSGKALSAIKELLDRKEGKITDKREIVHKMGKLRDEELDALVLTALQEAAVDGKED